jgi:hypothetical protein
MCSQTKHNPSYLNTTAKLRLHQTAQRRVHLIALQLAIHSGHPHQSEFHALLVPVHLSLDFDLYTIELSDRDQINTIYKLSHPTQQVDKSGI